MKLTKFRWWLWERSEWLSYYICPDKKALGLVRRDGWAKAKQELERSRRALQEVQE